MIKDIKIAVAVFFTVSYWIATIFGENEQANFVVQVAKIVLSK